MWIKICGITRIEDAQAAAAAGAEAVGLNFYPGSRRFVHPDEAKEIAEAVPPSLDVVGVFVNSSVQDVIGIVRRAQLTAVQFHGDETAESVAVFQEACPEVAVVRAFRLRTDALEQVIKSIHELRQSGVVLAAVLVDAFVADAYGGTGHMIAADLFEQFRIRSVLRAADTCDPCRRTDTGNRSVCSSRCSALGRRHGQWCGNRSGPEIIRKDSPVRKGRSESRAG